MQDTGGTTTGGGEATVRLGCSGCGAVLRVPEARLAEGPRCPRCKAPVFTGAPLELTTANWAAVVERSDLPVVVDFWAAWCAPCRAMAPVFADACARLEPRLRFAKLDTEAEPALAARFGIRSIPTLLVLRDGRELARHAGAVDRGTLMRWLAGALGVG